MMRTLKQRVLSPLVATTVAAACFAVVGIVLGRAIALRMAEAKLLRDATFASEQGDAFSSESRALLATLNASPYPFCSEAEIAWFRKLLFQSKYIRDAGRMRDGTIDCSATMSRADLPLEQFKPDRSQPDGTLVFGNLPLFRVGNSQGFLLQLGDSYVVYSPHLLENQGTISSRIIYTPTVSSVPRNGQIGSGLSQTSAKIFTENGQARLGDNLYVTRCSARYFRCSSATISVAEAMANNRVYIMSGAALGGLIGAFAGLLSSLLYRRNRSMEHQLRRAIARDKLRVVYQPIMNLASRRIAGAEALARWTDEEGFAVGPDVFVRIAEQRGFVGAITKLVVRHALRDFEETLRSHPDFRLSINVAAADLSDQKFLPMLEEALGSSGVLAQSLAIEITERFTAGSEVALETICRIRQRGLSVHIDDFGTGYSSLSYLHAFSVDTIKIDQSFTRAIGTEAVTVSILPQILAMAETLKLPVIVEGVETELQADYLTAAAQPLFAQGWFFGYPVPADEFHALLAADEKKALVPEDAA